MTEPSGPVEKKRFPTPVQAVVLTLAGFAMAFFGCLGAISEYDSSDVLFGIALVVSIVGAIALLIGVIMVAVLFIRGVMKAIQDGRQKTITPGDATPVPVEKPPPPDAGGLPRE